VTEVFLHLRIGREIEGGIDVVRLAALVLPMTIVMVPRRIDHPLHHRVRDARIEAQIPRFVEQICIVERRHVGQIEVPSEAMRAATMAGRLVQQGLPDKLSGLCSS